MTCPYTRSLLEDYVDKELSPARADEVAKHLTTCDACRAEYEDTLKLKSLLSRRAVHDPHPEYWKEVSSLILARTVDSAPFEATDLPFDRVRSSERTSFVRSLISVAASLGIFVAAISFGSVSDMASTEVPPSIDRQVLSTSTLVASAHADAELEFTLANQERVSGAMLLLGPPGLLGRFPEMATALGIE
jgi:anti-sigma factor RsiW